MKVYAKNPAELVIENPTKKTKKMAKRKRDNKGRYAKKRKNPAGLTDEITETGKNLFMQYGLAALASTGVISVAKNIIAQVDGLPDWAREWGVLLIPAAGGIGVSMLTDSKNAITQGVAGGMFLASVNGLSDKFLGGANGDTDGLGNVEKGDLIVKKDGYIYDQKGNRIAAVSNNGNGNSQKQLTAGWDRENHSLGEPFAENWETGETWEP